jgi:hypothetical protein
MTQSGHSPLPYESTFRRPHVGLSKGFVELSAANDGILKDLAAILITDSATLQLDYLLESYKPDPANDEDAMPRVLASFERPPILHRPNRSQGAR